MRCLNCGSENPAGKKFCGDCGALLDGRAPVLAREPRGPLPGERRHLTVLFCDLVSSTAIAARLDPEEWRETVGEYHRAAAEAITRYGGYVAQFLGDGVMAYFGWPEAHDNNAERAAHAGLAIIDAISQLNEHSTRLKLSARVGIDSGGVVVGAGVGKSADVFGDTPNIAARVQAAADPGTVLITDAVQQLIWGLFVVDSRGTVILKGIERPVLLYRLIQPSGARGRLEATAVSRGLTPFVGRQDELRLLMSRWERARDGEGQVVLVIGEAGIGKSRLLQRFHEQLQDGSQAWIEAAAGPFFQNTPFYPVSELLRQLAALGGDKESANGGATIDRQLAQLESALVTGGLKPAEATPLIAPLLNLPVAPKYRTSALPPEQQRCRLLATLVNWVSGAARRQPLIIATEDLHWADASTVELIQLLVEQGKTSPLLLLYTARPEFRLQWPLRGHHTQVTLDRLSARNVREMIAQVAARNALASATVDTVVERTGGVPLFVEELTRAVLESGAGELTGREIPVTLHDSLMARLDRLGAAKEVAQIAAVIGPEFSYELLQAVHPIAQDDLQRVLRSLADAELIYVRGLPPEATYQFKHALVRDVAYEALLKSRRKDLHRLVARSIDEKFPALKQAQPEILALHWTEAGETERAISEWSRAGEAAQEHHAFSEALESYQQAVVLLNRLRESPERDLRELKLRKCIFSMLQMTKGWVAPETLHVAERAATLAEHSGNLEQLGNSLWTRGYTAFLSAELSTAAALANEALDLALCEGDPATLASRYLLEVMVRYWRGDLAGSEERFKGGLRFFDDLEFRRDPIGPAVTAFAYGSLNAWMRGHCDLARVRMAQMLAAVNASNPHHRAYSNLLAACLHFLMRDYGQAETCAAHALEVCEKHRLPNDAAMAQCLLGSARGHLGHTTEDVLLIRQARVYSRQSGVGIGATWFEGLLAEAQQCAGAVADALETIELALGLNPEELLARPELLRIRGELRLTSGLTEMAEADFGVAIGLAQKMGTKAWELRTTISLARLLRYTGRNDAARRMLAEIYNWFTEGFDTADLKEAKALLDELEQQMIPSA